MPRRLFAKLRAVAPWWGLQTLVLAAALSSFWPMAKGRNVLLAVPDEQALSLVSVASLSLLVPLALDWAVDIFVRFVLVEVDNTTLQFHLSDYEKIVLYSGLGLYPMVALASNPFICPSCSDTLGFGLLYFTAIRFQVVAVVGTLWASLHRFDPTLWSARSTAVGVVVLTVAVNVSTGNQVYGGNAWRGADVASTALVAVVVLMFLVPAALWMLRTRAKMNRMAAKETFDATLGAGIMESDEDEASPSRVVFDALYLVVATASGATILLMFVTLNPLNHVRVYMGLLAGLEVGLIFYACVVKLETIYYLADVLQEKKAFVRFIGHEIRTPLNSAMLGMRLLLSTLNDIEVEDRDELVIETLDTANDVSKVRASIKSHEKRALFACFHDTPAAYTTPPGTRHRGANPVRPHDVQQDRGGHDGAPPGDRAGLGLRRRLRRNARGRGTRAFRQHRGRK